MPASEQYDPGSPSPDEPPSAAQRTRAMEEKKSGIDRKYEAARAGGLSPEEAERAYQEAERERLELNRYAEGAASQPADPPPPDDAGAADYPPPPG